MTRYALIDAARDPRIYDLLQTEPEARCLLGGKVEPVLARAAPHIVPLKSGSQVRAVFQSHGWLHAWGLVCLAPAPLADVRRQLRRCLQAMLPDGRTGLFRFYDPRVFVPMMMQAKSDELDPWFDPITDYWAPHPETGATLRFLRSGKGDLRFQEMSPVRAVATARAMQARPSS